MDSKVIKSNDDVNEIVLAKDLEAIRIKLDNFNKNMHKAPKPKEIANHKMGFEYIPIDIIQKKADKYFLGLWKWELLFEPKIIINEVMCCGRFHYFHPTAGVWLFRDGVGVNQIRFESKTDWTKIENKIQTALQMDVPHAEAGAMTSAISKIGDTFGRNLRRDIQAAYQGYQPQKEPEEITDEQTKLYEATLELIDKFNNAKTLYAEFRKVINEVDEKLPTHMIEKIEKAVQVKYDSLNKGGKNE